jgi:hypothetical protein
VTHVDLLAHSAIAGVAMLGTMGSTLLATTEGERFAAKLLSLAMGAYFLGSLLLLVRAGQ